MAKQLHVKWCNHWIFELSSTGIIVASQRLLSMLDDLDLFQGQDEANVGLSPLPVIVEMKLYRDSLLKNVIILVVTLYWEGGQPKANVFLFFSP